MRVKSFVPSFLIVSGRSKGRRAYIVPPAKWQGVHFDSSRGRTCVLKSTRVCGVAEGEGFAGALTPDNTGTASPGFKPSQALSKETSAKARMSTHTLITWRCYSSRGAGTTDFRAA